MPYLEGLVVNDKSDYNFASTDINDFAEELKTPKQEQNIDDEDIDESVFQDPENEEPEKLKATPSVAKATGNLLALAMDSGMSTLLGGVVAHDKPENYRLTPDEKSDLVDALEEYVKLKGGDIPPGLALVIVILSIYLPKSFSAFTYRKESKENELLDAKIKKLEAKLEEAQAEREELDNEEDLEEKQPENE